MGSGFIGPALVGSSSPDKLAQEERDHTGLTSAFCAPLFSSYIPIKVVVPRLSFTKIIIKIHCLFLFFFGVNFQIYKYLSKHQFEIDFFFSD